MLLAKSADANGKAESLFDHSRRVVAMASLLYQRLPAQVKASAQLRIDLESAAALHDIGKAASGFQEMLAGARPDWNGWRHEVLSAAFASDLPLSEEVIFAILTHHRQIPGASLESYKGRLHWPKNSDLPEDWLPVLEDWRTNEAQAHDLWRTLCACLGRADLAQSLNAQLSTIKLDSAWLDHKLFRKQRKHISAERRMGASLLRGLLISADHLASAGLDSIPPSVDLRSFKPKFVLRDFQKACGVPGNLILRAPTGSGKTEAALIWAGFNQPENGRFFYTLPYTAALNAMYNRLQDEFPSSHDSIGLLHGRAAHHLYDAAHKDAPTDKQQATREAQAKARLARDMYHPLRVCTPHQLLRFALCGKGWEQMLSEIPGAALVFDEVHSYDPALAGLTLATARLFHSLGAHLMFVSATLPRFLEKKIAQLIPSTVICPDPSSETDRAVLVRKRHVLQVVDQKLLELIPQIEEAVLAGRKALVVCNHVRSAQQMAQALRARLGEGEQKVCLFHGRFNMNDRRDKEKALASKSLPDTLVATQVVEVSLDISFDIGFFEAAPIDALAQRMGRVNRKGERDPATIVIAANAISKHRLYESALTTKTLELLRNRTTPLSEQDLVQICDEVYGDGYSGQDLLDFEERLNYAPIAHFTEHVVAGQHQDWIEKVLDGQDGRGDVLPAQLLPEYEKCLSERRWLDADALLVNGIYLSGVRNALEKREDVWIVNLPYGRNGLET